MGAKQRGLRSFVALAAAVCATVSAALAIYCVLLVYAAATVEHDSLPGAAVLNMVAVAVGLAALLSGGLAHILWRRRQRRS